MKGFVKAEDILDKYNGNNGHRNAYCVFCESTSYNGKEGIKHVRNCPISLIREIIKTNKDSKKEYEILKYKIREEQNKEPYLILLNKVYDKKLNGLSKEFEIDKNILLSKIIIKFLNGSNKIIMENLLSQNLKKCIYKN